MAEKDFQETVIKVKLWGIIIIASLLFGWFFIANASHDRRITTLETQYIGICEKLGDIKSDTKDIKISMETHIREHK